MKALRHFFLMSLICVTLFYSSANATSVCGSYTTNQHWTTTGNPYDVTCTVQINVGVTLTVDPGVLVRFAAGKELKIFGKLQAIGTAGSPIQFTSVSSTPTAGDWVRLSFQPGSDSTSRISYATIAYSGSSYGAIYINGISPTIDNTTVSNSKTAGIYVTGSTANPTINAVTVSNCTSYGIQLNSSAGATVTNTTLSNNTDYAIDTAANTKLNGLSGMTITGNGAGLKNGIRYEGGAITAAESWHAGVDRFVVALSTVNVGASLTIDPGSVVKFTTGNSGITVNGKLTADGTSTAPISFVSGSSSPAPGDWSKITFAFGSDPASRISFASISNGGSGNYGNIYIDRSSPSIEHVTSSNSSAAGIKVSGSTASPSITNCAFIGNVSGIINGTTTNVIQAKLNYWNSSNGPSGSGPGTGQSVTAGVVFEPWLMAAPSSQQYISTTSVGNRTFNPSIGINLNLAFTTVQSGNWTMKVLNGSTAIRTISGSGTSANPSWDGKNDGGVVQPNGNYTYQLASVTGGGQAATIATGPTIINNTQTLSISGLSAAPGFFSPNGDTVQDICAITALISFDGASWTLNMRNSSNVIVRTVSGVSAAVSFGWDGNNSLGNLQPDGIYTAELVVTDGPNSISANTSTTLDGTFPTANIVSPSQNATLSNIYQNGATTVSVVGTISDLNLNNWALERGNGASPSSWSSICFGTGPISNATICAWATETLANGIYSLRVRVWDKAGNLTTTANRTDTVGNFSMSANVAQLNSVTGETVTYASIVPFAVTQTVTIKNASGQTVRTLVNSANRSQGTYNDVWNGKGDQGGYVPDGPYSFYSTVSAGSSTITYDLSTQYKNDFNTFTYATSCANNLDPFNNKGYSCTYSFTSAGRVSIMFRKDQWIVDYDCTAPTYCVALNRFEESGSHTFQWSGLSSSGGLLGDPLYLRIISSRASFPKNVVVVYGTRPNISTTVQAMPSQFRPDWGSGQSVTLDFSTFQGQSASVQLEFMNLASQSTLRTVVFAGQSPGHFTWVWDGRADNGMRVAPGLYMVTAAVTDALGNSVKNQIATNIQY